MPFRQLAALFLTASLLSAWGTSAKTVFTFAGSAVELLDSADAAALNGASDAYTKTLTPFDLSIRLDKPAGAAEEDYLYRAAAAVHSWSMAEAADLKRAFSGIERFLAAHNITLPLPPVIQMIKTDGTEEFEAEGYTRGTRIMLNTGAQPVGMHLLAHELFHVVSRADTALRNRVYAVFGFQPCNPISVNGAVDGRGITNPDCPVVEHFIELKDGTETRSFTLVLYSGQDYKKGGNLGDYASIGLLELVGEGRAKRPAPKGGLPIIRSLPSVPTLFQKIGTNTQYLLHPEEISAEHFAMLVAGEEAREEKFLKGVEDAFKGR